MVGSREVSESGIKLICWVAAAALAGATLAIPQAVDPWEMPSLVLDRQATSDAIRFDQSLAADAPQSPEAQTVRSLFLAHGRAETNRPYPLREHDRRQAAIHHAIQALLAKRGPSALAAMRARAVEDFVHVFYDLTPEERSAEDLAILGGFTEIVARYGLVRGHVVIAPELTVRALYKARWNAIHRLPFTDGFSEIELQAYWGWLALHGWGQPLPKREEALLAFGDAGGAHVEEAAALFDLLGGRPDRAASSLQTLYSETGQLRLRNMSLGALHAALLQTGTP
jgi:hypothetical protein